MSSFVPQKRTRVSSKTMDYVRQLVIQNATANVSSVPDEVHFGAESDDDLDPEVTESGNLPENEGKSNKSTKTVI